MIKVLKKIGSVEHRYAPAVTAKIDAEKPAISISPTFPDRPPVLSQNEPVTAFAFVLPFAPAEVLDAGELELFTERAAIMESDAQLSRFNADRAAIVDVIEHRDRGAPEQLLEGFDCVEIKGELYSKLYHFPKDVENGTEGLPGNACKESIRKVEEFEHRLFGA